ncbi:uncharacterized protein DEA37_0005562 [Paragonimus westermani]|uniref:Uncharacterized protein n=1 Tax=Paragonimus westermani TaxID=34504 RepID=A0A5J4NA78_9TREM|nr:uncharacterized protein DEA37_0005562 [Paragonimus westermani]
MFKISFAVHLFIGISLSVISITFILLEFGLRQFTVTPQWKWCQALDRTGYGVGVALGLTALLVLFVNLKGYVLGFKFIFIHTVIMVMSLTFISVFAWNLYVKSDHIRNSIFVFGTLTTVTDVGFLVYCVLLFLEIYVQKCPLSSLPRYQLF